MLPYYSPPYLVDCCHAICIGLPIRLRLNIEKLKRELKMELQAIRCKQTGFPKSDFEEDKKRYEHSYGPYCMGQ